MIVSVKYGCLCFLVISLAGLLSAPAYARDNRDDNQVAFQINYTVELDIEDYEFNIYNSYDLILHAPATYQNVPGQPFLPVKIINVALPEGMAVADIIPVRVVSEDLEKEFDIFPSQKPLKTGRDRITQEFVRADSQIYLSAQPYPAEPLIFIKQTDIAGQSMAVIGLYPFQYHPAEKRLIFNRVIEFKIEGVPGYEPGDFLPSGLSLTSRTYYEKTVRNLVTNPDEVRLTSSTTSAEKSFTDLPSGSYEHVIITSAELTPYFQPLVYWNTKKGIKDTVVTTDWIDVNFTGTDRAERVRNFIIEAHSSWGAMFFLLGGESDVIPFKTRIYMVNAIPSDAYYSDYDDDWLHEVMVGRATVEDSTETARFINKVITYETNPLSSSYTASITLIGMDLTLASDPPYYLLTAGEVTKKEIDSLYLSPHLNVNKIYDSYTSNHMVSLMSALNVGQNLVNHYDHSDYISMGAGHLNHSQDLYFSDIDNLTNTNQLSILYSMGCDANRMDYNDCVGEHFVIYNDSTAGAAFIGNTRNGWFLTGEPSTLSAKLDMDWWRALFQENISRLGEALVWTKNNNPVYDTTWMYTHWTLNLLGDPMMTVWTDTPSVFVVNHPAQIETLDDNLTVGVTDAVGTVAGARVCIWKDGEVFESGFTDANGEIEFTFAPAGEGTMLVTITKQNYIPYQSSLEVVLIIDTDNDGIRDEEDNCPLVYNPDQIDTDNDTFGDSCDNCPNTANLLQEDSDTDGLGDSCDTCVDVFNPSQVNSDSDMFGDSCDNCPYKTNLLQEDTDLDGFGDSCDNCISVINPAQSDGDNDAVGDSCDNCPNTSNSDQFDSDSDTVGDACDKCPGYNDYEDIDSDSVPDSCDNCIDVYNPAQADNDGVGDGDACCCIGYRGNVNCSVDEQPDISDITFLISSLYLDGPALCCPDEADCNGSGEEPDISDITALINHLYLDKNPLSACP